MFSLDEYSLANLLMCWCCNDACNALVVAMGHVLCRFCPDIVATWLSLCSMQHIVAMSHQFSPITRNAQLNISMFEVGFPNYWRELRTYVIQIFIYTLFHKNAWYILNWKHGELILNRITCKHQRDLNWYNNCTNDSRFICVLGVLLRGNPSITVLFLDFCSNLAAFAKHCYC